MSWEPSSRRRGSVALCGIFIALGILACGGDTTAPADMMRLSSPAASRAAASHAKYTGEVIFEGLWLGDGPVAALFPEYFGTPTPVNALPAKERAKARAQIAAFTAAIKRADPSFFNTFGADMQSGDRVRVAQATAAANAISLRVGRALAVQNAKDTTILVHAADDGSYLNYNTNVNQTSNVNVNTNVNMNSNINVQSQVNVDRYINATTFANIDTFINYDKYINSETGLWSVVDAGESGGVSAASQLQRDRATDLIASRLGPA